MNQTELSRKLNDPENENTLNRVGSISKTKITLKANVYQNFKEFTPKLQNSQRNNSSNKLKRVNSSKGIKVISSRPSSSEKQTKQFTETVHSFYSREQSIKHEEKCLIEKMREQLTKVNRIYQDKMNQQLSYQYNFMNLEIERLKQIIQINQAKIQELTNHLSNSSQRINQIDQKSNKKIASLQKEVKEFKKYFEKCQQYTLNRVNDVDNRVSIMCKEMEEVTCPVRRALEFDSVQIAYDTVRRMSSNWHEHEITLTQEIKKQIFELEIILGECRQNLQGIEESNHEVKLIKDNNQTMKEVRNNMFLRNQNQSKSEQFSEIQINEKVNQIDQVLKRIKNCEIQIGLINILSGEQEKDRDKKKTEEMQKIIETLDKKIDQDKVWYLKIIKEKEQTLAKTNPRITELEQRLKNAYQIEAQLNQEVSEQNLKIAFLQTKCEKFNQRQYNLQTSLAEAFSETILNEKIKKFQVEKSGLQSKISDLQSKINHLDHENYLLASKMIDYESCKSENSKLSCEISFLTSLSEQNKKDQSTFLDQIQSLNEKNRHFQASIKKLEDKNKQLSEKKSFSAEDELYIDEIESQLEKKALSIANYQQKIEQFSKVNQYIKEENRKLQNDLQTYAQTFERQSITFRNAIKKLQVENDSMMKENELLKKQNKIIKLDLEMTKSEESFFKNNSELSLKKTYSTQLSSPKQNYMKVFGNSEKKQMKVQKLEQILNKMKLEFPVLCEIDKKGDLKEEGSGKYIIDENNNHFSLNLNELSEAISKGLILL